jgi:DNA mismatch repair ATPase MutS
VNDVRHIRIRRSLWGKVMHEMLFTHHARVDVYKYDSVLQRFVVAQTGTPSDWAQLEVYVGDDVEAEGAVSKPIVAIYEEKSSVGVFALYKAAQKVSVCSFADNASFDALESALVQLSPMECFLLEETKRSNPALVKLLQAGNYLTNTVTSRTSDVRAVMKTLEKRVDFSGVNRVALEKDDRLALLAASMISKLVLEDDGQHEEGKEPQKMAFQSLPLSNFMKVSTSTMDGLNIFGTRSLYKLLSYTRTSGGDRMLKTWLKQPLIRAADIGERLDAVEALVEDACLRKSLHDESLRKISDLDMICGKMRKKRTTLSDLYKAFLTVIEAQKIYSTLKETGTGFINFDQDFVTWLKQSCYFSLQANRQLTRLKVDKIYLIN